MIHPALWIGYLSIPYSLDRHNNLYIGLFILPTTKVGSVSEGIILIQHSGGQKRFFFLALKQADVSQY